MTLLPKKCCLKLANPIQARRADGRDGLKRMTDPNKHQQEDQDGAILPSYTALPLERGHQHAK